MSVLYVISKSPRVEMRWLPLVQGKLAPQKQELARVEPQHFQTLTARLGCTWFSYRELFSEALRHSIGTLRTDKLRAD